VEPTSLSSQDAEHLRLLSIFHYVLAAVTGLTSLIPLVHLTVGIFLLTAPPDGGRGQPPPAWFGVFFVVLALFLITTGLTMATLIFLTGRNLVARRRYTLCLVTAGLECLFVPLGIALGIFTILVLTRPAVKDAFASAALAERSPVSP
jgi:hypothetical protein